MKIGHLIPEFPGQTHIWMWREIQHLRDWGAQIQIISTRQPPERDRARHAFANDAARTTLYLWPRSFLTLCATFLWAVATRPLGLWRCLILALTLPVNNRPRWRTVLPLVLPACVLARHAIRHRIQHLHCHTCANGAILAMMLKRLTAIPYSMTLNANIENWGGAMREKLADAAFTIAITQWLLDQVRRDYPTLREDQVLLARLGVDTRKWRPLDNTPRPGQIITVGRLHACKGHDVLLRAIARLVKLGRDVRLSLVGSGPDQPELETLANQLGLQTRVEFTGSLAEDQVMTKIAQSQVFALASHAEPFGVVYLEAMAMEVATIGTAAGGVGEIITSNVDGLLVPPNDPDALADAIDRLLSNEQLRRQIAIAGRQTVVHRFDSRIGAAVLFQRLTGHPPRPPQELPEPDRRPEPSATFVSTASELTA